MDKEMSKKVENDAAAFARSIATERGRNVEWAERAVRSSVSATEREAVKLKVVDLVADSVPDLLAKIDGRVVKTPKGSVTLATKDAAVTSIAVGFRDRFLALITDPNVAYILMMVGMLGIFFELSTPGAILPGVLGGISLILAFFAFQSLPINWAGLLLILFGLALLVAEIKIVSHGILTIGGVVSMVLGSMMLYDAPETGLRISWLVIIPTVGAMAGLVIAAVSMGLRALYRPASTGAAGMMGQVGVVKRALDPEGQGADRRRAVAGGGRGWARRRGRDGSRGADGRADAHGDAVGPTGIGTEEAPHAWLRAAVRDRARPAHRILRDPFLGAHPARVRARRHLPIRPPGECRLQSRR
jgi:membrane-bound serine protease (ClpP class)